MATIVVCSTSSLDQFFLLINGILVFFMQAGFAFLEAGTISSKNVTNILFKNYMDFVIGAISYFAVGYAFAYGANSSDFIGNTGFFFINTDYCQLAEWFFQFTFAATATTIISGAMAERTAVTGYIAYSIVVTGFVYPVVTYWVWSGNPWLLEEGYVDFAGSGVVHATGGTAALVGAYFVGPRNSVRIEGSKRLTPIPPHSIPFAALGGLILIFGFFGFNGGSVLAITDTEDDNGDIYEGANGLKVSRAIVNTILAAAGGALTAVLYSKIFEQKLSLMAIINGAVAGMVSICAGADAVHPWAGLVIGAVGGLAYVGTAKLVALAGIDDAIDAVGVHLGAGSWGLIATAFFHFDAGIFYGGDGDFLGWQIAGLLTIVVWTAGVTGILFGILSTFGLLRVDSDVEECGLDDTEHGEKAYEFHDMASRPADHV